MNIRDRKRAMILGAFVADAASMGTHWIYDQEHLRKIVGDTPEFVPPDPANYEGVPAFFAHPTRTAGDLSHYGAQLLVMLRSLVDAGGYDRAAYEQEFVNNFGYGGSFVGYIDRPTRATLDAIAARAEGDTTSGYAGADDVQLPAVSKLPALIAALHGRDTLAATVEDAVRVTNNSDVAVDFAAATKDILVGILETGSLPDQGLEVPAVVADALAPAFARPSDSTQAVTKDIGMSCQLSYGLPSVVHNLRAGPTFRAAVRTNILAGGDTCGRAIVLGAALGGMHGVGGPFGIPEDWAARLEHREMLEGLIDQVVA